MKNGAGKRVFVGLSGGVDSAVSAALLQKAGYNVTGLFAWIALPGYPCTAAEDRLEALRVAAHLRIPFMETDLSEAYRNAIFTRTLEAYRRGETPNPDALCNREIKFGLLYDFAKKHGADFVATGHYARLEHRDGRTHLLAGVDANKDQSYFLSLVPEGRLADALFPVGSLQKPGVRALAEKLELPNAQRKDSQGLCFLGDVSMENALMRELKPEPGDVLDEEGHVIGQHRGAVLYTIGQRHGFTVHATGIREEPRYVIAKNVEKNTITVSPHVSTATPHNAQRSILIRLRETNWIGDVKDKTCHARFRYRQALIPVHLRVHDARTAEVELFGVSAVPEGQVLALYDDERCLGAGIMDSYSQKRA